MPVWAPVTKIVLPCCGGTDRRLAVGAHSVSREAELPAGGSAVLEIDHDQRSRPARCGGAQALEHGVAQLRVVLHRADVARERLAADQHRARAPAVAQLAPPGEVGGGVHGAAITQVVDGQGLARGAA